MTRLLCLALEFFKSAPLAGFETARADEDEVVRRYRGPASATFARARPAIAFAWSERRRSD